jgi:HAE1 family hydrophobic/amphiphilic exporter-1
MSADKKSGVRAAVDFALSHPVTVGMVVTAVLLLGKISYDRLGVELLPEIAAPRLFVEIRAGERPPGEIEKQFVRNIESLAIRQGGVTEVSSVIRAGSARTRVEYTWGKDMDEAFLDLQKAMTPLTQDEALESLEITQHDANMSPVVLIGMSHREITDVAELRKVAGNYVTNELIRIEGVAQVTLSGEEASVLSIDTDPYRLAAFNITIDDIAGRIEEANRSLSAGRVTELGIQYLVKSPSPFSSEADFGNMIVKTSDADNGNTPVHLKDVADVSFVNSDPENIVRINGRRSIGLSVYKEMRFNTVKVVDAVVSQLGSIEQALPGYSFSVISDQGTFIRRAVDEVKDSALLGIALAVAVLFIFLRRVGLTFIVSLAIPVSIVATFNLMFFRGLTLNIMTLGGLALGAGMLVDNAIVVIESIFRNQEKGQSLREAIVTGTSEVAGAVTASTLTTIVVFLPIVYLHGASGALFKEQAWTVAFSLVSSLFVAILVIPALYYRLAGKSRRKTVARITHNGFNRYGRLLGWLIERSVKVVVLSALFMAGTAALVPLVGTEFMPRTGGKAFTVMVKTPEGSSLERTASTVSRLESLLLSIAGDTTLTLYSHAGMGSGSDNAVFEGDNTAMMKVIFPTGFALSPDAVMTQFIETAESPGSLELSLRLEDNSLGSLFGSESEPVVVEIKGEDLDEIARLTGEVKQSISKIPGLYNIRSSVEDGAPEVNVAIDRNMAGVNNISVSTLTEQLKQHLAGREAGQMEYRGEMRDIRIQTPGVSLDRLGSLVIREGNTEYRLDELATFEHAQAPREIFRRNQSRVGTVTAGMADEAGSLDRVATEVRSEVSKLDVPYNYSITVTGEEAKRQESVAGLMFALLLSVVLVYMTLASQFESLLHPFTILLTIPLAVAGAIWLFFITGMTINMMGIIGIVMLAGIAVNNAIILVDRINQLSASGMELRESILEAGRQRIRPVIMTSLSTILALLPMAFNVGEGGSLRSPMAIAVIGGLVTSTLMTLIVIPCAYFLLESLKRKLAER